MHPHATHLAAPRTGEQQVGGSGRFEIAGARARRKQTSGFLLWPQRLLDALDTLSMQPNWSFLLSMTVVS